MTVIDETMQEKIINDSDVGSVEEADVIEQGEAAAGEAEQPSLSLEEQLAEAQAEASRNLEGWQRAQAEFANARKRLERQRMEAYVNANAEVATRLLPIVDDFERALQNASPAVESDGWYSGVELIYRKLLNVLDGMGVSPIEAIGQPFDPNLHEALGQEPSEEYDSGLVAREMQRGYRLGDRLIRPSLVYVAE